MVPVNRATGRTSALMIALVRNERARVAREHGGVYGTANRPRRSGSRSCRGDRRRCRDNRRSRGGRRSHGPARVALSDAVLQALAWTARAGARELRCQNISVSHDHLFFSLLNNPMNGRLVS